MPGQRAQGGFRWSGPVTDPAPPPAADTAAEAEILLELLGVAAHDLSNPLQSLSVLLELAVDEAEAGEPVADKLEHALSAAEQLRGLIRGLADFSRGMPSAARRRTAGHALDQALGVCARRFERQRIALVRATEAVDAVAPVDPRLPTVLLGCLLACVHAAGRSGMASHQLEVGASNGGETVEVIFSLTGDPGTPLALAPRDLDRIARSVGPNADHLAFQDLGPGRLALRLAALNDDMDAHG